MSLLRCCTPQSAACSSILATTIRRHADVSLSDGAPSLQKQRKRRRYFANASQQRVELGEVSSSRAREENPKNTQRVPLLSRCLLAPLAVPGVGQWIQRFLAASAGLHFVYTFPVSVYRRTSCAPPLSSSREIDESAPNRGDADASSSSSTATKSLGFLAECHPSLYIGRSAIHGRGVMTRTAIKKGTRIITVPELSFMDAVQFLIGCSDTHKRLPGTLHYSLPTGRFREFIQGAHAHHFMNHSCRSNVCTGLSSQWWWEATNEGAGGGMVGVMEERMRTFPHFDDPNSFFTSRDVEAGEELTLDYYGRFGHVTHPRRAASANAESSNPLAQRESARGTARVGGNWLLSMMKSAASRDSTTSDDIGTVLNDCRCGQPQCRGDIFPRTPVMLPQRTVRDVYSQAEYCVGSEKVLIDLDESMLVSTLRAPSAVTSYISSNLHATHDETSRRCRWKRQTSSKRSLLVNYRHVFQELNLLEPDE
jgi:hypothetical protein